MSFKEKANSRLIKMRDTMQGYYNKKDQEKKNRMNIFKQYFYSITSFEKYTEFVKYSFSNNFLYLFILVLIAAILSAFSVSYTFDKNYGKEIEKELAEVGNYIVENIEDISITNGKLKIKQSDVIKITNTNKVFETVIIDTREELNDDLLSGYKEEITKENKAGVILTQDKVYFNGINSKAGEEVEETKQKEEIQKTENVSSQEQTNTNTNTNILEITPTVQLNQASQEELQEESKEETQNQPEQNIEETQKTENEEQQDNTINENKQEETSVINQYYFSEMTYSDLLKEFKLEDLDKAGILMLCTPDFANVVIRKIDLIMFQDYILISVLTNCISILFYLLILVLIGKLLAKIFRITTDTKALAKIAIHSLTLPLTLLWIYTIVNTFTGFTIQHFTLLFFIVAVIYILAVLLLSRTDVIATATQEIINPEDAKKKEEEELQREEEEKRKKEEEKEKEKEEKRNQKNNKKKKSKQKSDTKENLGLEGNQ